MAHWLTSIAAISFRVRWVKKETGWLCMKVASKICVIFYERFLVTYNVRSDCSSNENVIVGGEFRIAAKLLRPLRRL